MKTPIPSGGYSFLAGERCLVLTPRSSLPVARLRGDQWCDFEDCINQVREHWRTEIAQIDADNYDEVCGDRPQGIYTRTPSGDIQQVCRMFYRFHRQRLARHQKQKLQRKAL